MNIITISRLIECSRIKGAFKGGRGKNPLKGNFEKIYIIFTYSFYLIISKLRMKEEKRA